MNDPATIVELRDEVEHLAKSGYRKLLRALRDPDCIPDDGSCAGQVNVAAVARRLGVSWAKASQLLAGARAALMA